jgi:hypothetical protein
VGLTGMRSHKRDDDEEGQGNHDVHNDPSDGRESPVLPRRRGWYGAERLNKPDRIAAAAPVHVDEAVSLTRAAAAQIRENDVGGKRTRPDEPAPRITRARSPAKVAHRPTRGLARVRARRLPSGRSGTA